MNKIIVIIAVVVLGAGSVVWFLRSPLQGSKVAQAAQQITAFIAYYFKNGPPSGFTVAEESVQYANDIFIFQLKNTGSQKVTVTQQAATEDTSGIPQGSEKVDGVSGNGAISFANGQVVGVLVTDKHTLVILTAPAAVGSETIKDIMRNLVPAK